MITPTDGLTHQLSCTDSNVLRLLQITDCHIFAEATSCLQGMNTRQSFTAVCHQIIENKDVFDAILATGDLSQDGSAQSYRFLAQWFERLQTPTYWIPGNHDDVAVMRENLISAQLNPAKLLLSEHWLVILLDSTIKNQVSGRVAQAQLDFLETALQQNSAKHALVCLHHQPIDVGSYWIDQKGLQEREGFHELISRHDNIRAVLWGHVHQQTQRSIAGVEWMSTPSSCVQFEPGADAFSVSDEAPGYRRLALYADGRIETSVERIEAIPLRGN